MRRRTPLNLDKANILLLKINNLNLVVDALPSLNFFKNLSEKVV
jgi:hypothetical protein